MAGEERLYRISEVSRLTALKPFVLRYWESEFPMLQPVKSTTGYRLYRQQDVDLVFAIKRLLYEEGLTIAGARRHLQDQGASGNGSGATEHRAVSIGAPEGATAEQASTPEALPASRATAGTNGTRLQVERQTLVELRDALRSFLTLLERK